MKRLLLFVFIIVFSTIVAADEAQQSRKAIHIVLSGGDAIYYTIAKSLEDIVSKTKGLTYKIDVTTIENSHLDVFGTDDLLVPIGEKAAQELIRYQASNTIIYSFVENELIQRLKPDRFSSSWAAVTVNQPIERLLRVADGLVKTSYKNNIVVIASKDNTELSNKLSTIDFLRKGQLVIIEVDIAEVISKRVERTLFNAAALIATDEKAVWSSSNAKWLLRQAYNYQVPVVGNSRRFLKAGALISVYSSMEKLSEATSQLIKQWLEDGRLSNTGSHTVAGTIDVNKSIAKALGYKLNELKLLKVDN